MFRNPQIRARQKQAFSRMISWYFFRYERKLILSEKNDVGGTTAYKQGRLAETGLEMRNTGWGRTENRM